MRFISTSSVVLGFIVLGRQAFSQPTWWIDESCDGMLEEGEIDKMMEEAVEAATMVRDRVSRARSDEPDAHLTFESLFKFGLSTTDPLDMARLNTFKRIIGGFDGTPAPYGISTFKKSTGTGDADRKLSKFRIYCDNGERWEEVEDGDERLEPKLPMNSQRGPEAKEYFDPINKMWSKGYSKCEPEETDTYMETFSWSGVNEYDIGQGGDELDGRATITICDAWLDLDTRITRLKPILSNDNWWPNLEGQSVDTLVLIGSMSLLHELTHTWPHLTEDKAYGAQTFLLPKEVGFMNADSYAVIAAIALTMERKFALDREAPIAGVIKKYDDIPDRVTQ